MSEVDAAEGQVQINLKPVEGQVAEPAKKTRKPRVKKVAVKKTRKSTYFHILVARAGTWVDTGVTTGTTYDTAMRTLRQMEAGDYWIVRGYGTKTVKVVMVPKVTVE